MTVVYETSHVRVVKIPTMMGNYVACHKRNPKLRHELTIDMECKPYFEAVCDGLHTKYVKQQQKDRPDWWNSPYW